MEPGSEEYNGNAALRFAWGSAVQLYGYDKNGSRSYWLKSGQAHVYKYDAGNHLIEVRQNNSVLGTFVYTGDGQRVKGTVSGVSTTYINGIFEWTGSTTTMKKYYAGAMRTGSGTGDSGVNFLLRDHLGLVTRSLDYTGAALSDTLFKAWGEARYTSGSAPTTMKYTGQREESGLGLYFYNARWYDAGLSRFAQADTVIPNPSTVSNFDRYSYVENNPVRFTDESGHCSGNPDDKKNKDRACWKRYFKIREAFPNVYLDGFDWTLEQLKLIQESLRLVRNAFGGQHAFARALGNFSILKRNTVSDMISALGFAPAGLDTIYLNTKIFTFDRITVLFKIIHEIGHIFDFKDNGGNPSKYKSQLFVGIFAPGCDTGYFGCVSSNSSYSGKNFGGSNDGWNPTPDDTTIYGPDASIEDFADSFAVYVMTIGGLIPPETVSGDRYDFIGIWIDLTN